ncbi:EamA family transporter RarD [Arcanobacterium ihumii]|uniref:EamA family transporter RarD n=1 Tax=Arcanobacterium ihumii TaxID=2138162 RepID=UPI002E0F1F90
MANIQGYQHEAGTRVGTAQAWASGVGAYFLWGLFPLYFSLLEPANSLEVIVHRAVWGMLSCLIAISIVRQWKNLREVIANRAVLGRLCLAGFLIVINWTTYIFAVQSGHTVDAALGYFINPLITVALGVVVLKETLTRMQKIAVALGATAVIYMLISMGSLPWLALGMATSFGLYSLVKKRVAHQVNPLVGMAVETSAVVPLLLIYYGYLVANNQTSFHTLSNNNLPWMGHLLLLIGAGVLTIIPLILFAQASRGLSLGVIGLLQYLSPIGQLLIAVFVFHETMPTERWIGTAIVWFALVFLSIDGVRAVSRYRGKPISA